MTLMRDVIEAIRFQKELKGSTLKQILEYAKTKPSNASEDKLIFKIKKILQEALEYGFIEKSS